MVHSASVVLVCAFFLVAGLAAPAALDISKIQDLVKMVKKHEGSALGEVNKATTDLKIMAALQEQHKYLENEVAKALRLVSDEREQLMMTIRDLKQRAQKHDDAANSPGKVHARVQHQRMTQLNMQRMQEAEQQLLLNGNTKNSVEIAKRILSSIAPLLTLTSSSEGDL